MLEVTRPLALTLVVSLAAHVARAEEPVDCPSASERGQRLRAQNQYRDALEQFRSCAQATCPTVVRKDCVKWQSELEETMPSIVVGVVDENGRDMAEAEIAVDGMMVAERVDGKPLPIDPGPHELRATASERVPTTVPVVIRVGEKNRLVQLKFAAKLHRVSAETFAPAPSSAPPPAAAPRETSRVRHDYLPPLPTVILGGVGALGLGAFAALGITAKSQLGVLRDGCAPSCAPNEVDAVQRRMLAADLSLAVGVVALGAGTVLWVLNARRPVPAATRTSWSFGASPRFEGGASATFSTAF